jgi:hypothetical protein
MTYQKEAEDQRQIRDDVRKTLAERIEANDKLGKILERTERGRKGYISKEVRPCQRWNFQ